MARIAGVDLPKDKKIWVALTYIRGIGSSLSKKILEEVQISPEVKVQDLTEEQIGKIRDGIAGAGIRVEGELAAEVTMNIKRLKEIGSYRGVRHERGLPVRGQKTRTNARTRRGKKMAVTGTSKSAREAKKSHTT